MTSGPSEPMSRSRVKIDDEFAELDAAMLVMVGLVGEIWIGTKGWILGGTIEQDFGERVRRSVLSEALVSDPTYPVADMFLTV